MNYGEFQKLDDKKKSQMDKIETVVVNLNGHHFAEGDKRNKEEKEPTFFGYNGDSIIIHIDDKNLTIDIKSKDYV